MMPSELAIMMQIQNLQLCQIKHLSDEPDRCLIIKYVIINLKAIISFH